ncbi:hypothetical protein [Rummeliibacillus pycnus]|uniref:hypothetical protein n=1 Tax=Rummeliibacillus pycnus TaxID=101070 RepID=UPI0037C5D227
MAELYPVEDKSISTFAAGWQTIQTDWFTLHNDNTFRTSADRKIASSGGGDFGIRVLGHTPLSIKGTDSFIAYRLYEYDPQNADDFVAPQMDVPGNRIWNPAYDIVWRGISDYCDGIEGKAEFFATHSENYKMDKDLRIDYID